MRILRRLGVPNRLQLARLSYAYRKSREKTTQEEHALARRQNYEESFRSIAATVVEALAAKEKSGSIDHVPSRVLEQLESTGIASDGELVDGNQQPRMAGIAAAILLSSKYGFNIRSSDFMQTAVQIVKQEIAACRKAESEKPAGESEIENTE